MDLDALDKRDLSNLFLQCYNSFFPSMKTDDERKLFVFYKSYRANIRAKVNSLRARSAANNAEAKSPLAETEKYLKLMNSYLEEIKD
jgi:aminoglycoside phosphotransferase family enzyme